MLRGYLAAAFLATYLVSYANTCGTATHIDIAHEASTFFESPRYLKTDYAALIRKHQDAFVAGNPYPDAMYPSLCFGGKYHQVAEDTHWAQFLNASIYYVKDNYPQPWDEDTEKLVAFIFGFVSHQVADVTWHSLGIQQGFLRSMAAANFHGVFNDAHSDGDVGGDMLVMWDHDDVPIPISKWYVPVNDLYAIYKSFYRDEHVPKIVIELCSKLVYIEYIAEKIGGREIFKLFADKSPFLIQRLHNFFLGGIHDMASWTQLIWNDTAYMLEHGSQNCNVHHSTLFINCGVRNSSIPFGPTLMDFKNPGRGNRPLLHIGLSASDVITRRSKRGVYFHPEKLVKKLKELIGDKTENTRPDVHYQVAKPYAIITTKRSYAEFGLSMTKLRCNGESLLAVGAPNHGEPGQPQQGRVYVIDMNKIEFKLYNNSDLIYVEEQAKQVLVGQQRMSKFGWSITAVSSCVSSARPCLNDSDSSLIVAAPVTGANTLMYHGKVFVYNPSSTGLPVEPSEVIESGDANQYTNFGYSLRAHDGSCFSISAPFSNQQTGFATFLGDHCLRLHSEGNEPYSWYGYDTDLLQLQNGYTLVFTSAPSYRECFFPNCSFHPSDKQAVGAVQIRVLHKGQQKSSFQIHGDSRFGQFGWSISVGDPFGNQDYLLAISAPSKDIAGKIMGVPFTFTQAGAVFLYNISMLLDYHAANKSDFSDCIVATLEGDRSYGNYGGMLRFVDIRDSGKQQLIVGAPRRSWDITEELWGGEEGAVFIYGDEHGFPLGFVTSDCDSIFDTVPCPADSASHTFFGKEAGARFGAHFEVIPSRDRATLAISAPRSSLGSFHGGSINLYEI